MKIATKSNVRTAEAAKTSLSKALKVSFTGGSVMGMGVAGLAVLGLGALFLIIKQIFAPDSNVDTIAMERTIEILTGFSLEQNLLHFLLELVEVFIPKQQM
jgi:K(+)-stimulated pyrophosphate-energized sodium pump